MVYNCVQAKYRYLRQIFRSRSHWDPDNPHHLFGDIPPPPKAQSRVLHNIMLAPQLASTTHGYFKIAFDDTPIGILKQLKQQF